jgi:hypothetical protein
VGWQLGGGTGLFRGTQQVVDVLAGDGSSQGGLVGGSGAGHGGLLGGRLTSSVEV